jgi:hypothetical protein
MSVETPIQCNHAPAIPQGVFLGGNDMTYEEFKTAYTAAFNRAMSYKPSEVGSRVYMNQMADLADAYPEFADRVENENISA